MDPLTTVRGPTRDRSRNTVLIIRLLIEGLLAILVISFLVSASSNEFQQTNHLLADDLAEQKAQVTALQARVEALQAEVQDLKERWYGSPAIWQPQAIANTDIRFFDVTGSTQPELINSLNNSSLCTTYACLPDPANPGRIGWGLESFYPSTFRCYSPSTTTVSTREFIVLPRWSPPADGTLKIPLVEAWNALAQVIYTHEAGHVAITQRDLAALNSQAQQLPSCKALIAFWANPSVFAQMQADQNAYHAQLHADCRPEIGCIPYGWMGW